MTYGLEMERVCSQRKREVREEKSKETVKKKRISGKACVIDKQTIYVMLKSRAHCALEPAWGFCRSVMSKFHQGVPTTLCWVSRCIAIEFTSSLGIVYIVKLLQFFCQSVPLSYVIEERHTHTHPFNGP